MIAFCFEICYCGQWHNRLWLPLRDTGRIFERLKTLTGHVHTEVCTIFVLFTPKLLTGWISSLMSGFTICPCAERHSTKSGQIFNLDGWCQQDPSTSLPSCSESFGCHCHLQDDTRKVSAFGCKLIKNTTVFFLFKLSCRASIEPSLLPFEYSVGQGVHTVPVKLFSVPAKNPSPTLAFKG